MEDPTVFFLILFSRDAKAGIRQVSIGQDERYFILASGSCW
jgi:hypothetical protein